MKIDRAVTSGTFSIDGEDFEVDNNIWVVGDAAHIIFNRPSRECTGNFFIDDEVMRSAGITDLSEYAVDPTAQLMPDFFV